MKFNTKTKPEKVINEMGSKAYKLTPDVELAHAVLSTFLENTYYESATIRKERIAELVQKANPLFVAKLAVYARNEFHLRSVAHYLINCLTKHVSGDPIVRKVVNRIIERGNDITEIAASYLLSDEKLPNQVKLGLVDGILRMDNYQLAKSRGDDNDVSMVDVFNLVHPKPQTEEQTEWFRMLMNGELKLENTDTWEAALSSGKDKGEAFVDLLSRKKLGYMATLRNLRNIWQSGNSEAIHLAAEFIRNPKAVANSKQFPFRFLSAYVALAQAEDSYYGIGRTIRFSSKKNPDTNVLLEAIEEALNHSIANLPMLDGETVILIDNSGSMRGDTWSKSVMSKHSSVTGADVANLLGALYWQRANETYVGVFGDCLTHVELDPKASVMDNFAKVNDAGSRVGGSTEAGIYKAFRVMLTEKIKPARIVIFSDQQIGDGNGWYGTSGKDRSGSFIALQKEFQKFSPDTVIYSVDTHGKGDTVFDDRVIKLAGFSEKIFTLMEMHEKRHAMVEAVNKVEL